MAAAGDAVERYFLTVYDLLDVTLSADDFRGESAYNDLLAGVVDDLDRLGLLLPSGGADCVFPQGSAAGTASRCR